MSETILVLIVIALALSSLFALALTMHWGYKRETGLVPYIFYFSLTAAAIGVALSARDMSLEVRPIGVLMEKHPIALWLGRLSSAFTLLACAERIINRLVSGNRGQKLPMLLMLAFLTYFATNILAPAFFGRIPLISHEYLYMAVFGIAAMLFTSREVELTIETLRNTLLGFLVVSALFLVVRPSQVLDTSYTSGLIPFLRVRYAGLAPHANGLGPLTISFLICVWCRPFQRKWLNWFSIAIGLGSLLLTQSKTSWISFILTCMCVAYYGYRAEIAQRINDPRRPLLPVALLGGVMMLSLLAALVIMFGDLGAKFHSVMATREAAELSSFTGRDAIWEIAKQEWHRNPVFGYGLTIWNLPFQMSIHMPFATHAHSQFFQTVSSAGTVGLVGLVIYASTLLYLSVKTARISGGITLALFLNLVARGISEIPLSMTGFALDTVGHVLLLVVLLGYYPQLKKAQQKTMRNTRTLAPISGLAVKGSI